MAAAAKNKTPIERVVSLQFDETAMEPMMEYDMKNKTIVGPVKEVQVVQVRGIVSDWKQIIYSDFDKAMTPAIIYELVEKLFSIGYVVKVLISDLSTSNQKLQKELGVTLISPFFIHPSTNHKVYVKADEPHLIKLLRNHLIDGGIQLGDGHILNKKVLQELLDTVRPPGDILNLNSCFHLSQKLISVEPTHRQNVSRAVKLLSNKTATALTCYLKSNDSLRMADFITMVRIFLIIS